MGKTSEHMRSYIPVAVSSKLDTETMASLSSIPDCIHTSTVLPSETVYEVSSKPIATPMYGGNCLLPLGVLKSILATD